MVVSHYDFLPKATVTPYKTFNPCVFKITQSDCDFRRSILTIFSAFKYIRWSTLTRLFPLRFSCNFSASGERYRPGKHRCGLMSQIEPPIQ